MAAKKKAQRRPSRKARALKRKVRYVYRDANGKFVSKEKWQKLPRKKRARQTVYLDTLASGRKVETWKRKPAAFKKPTKKKKPGKKKPRKREEKPKLKKPSKVPERVIKPVPGYDSSDAAKDMREAFDTAKERLAVDYPDIDATYRVVENKDGTVDGQLTISNIRHGLTIKRLLLELESDILWTPPNHWLWISFVGDFEQEAAKKAPKRMTPAEARAKEYDKYRGMSKVSVYPQRPDVGKPYMFLTARGIAERLQEKGYRKPRMVLIKLHWNPEGKKPKRR